MTLANVDAGILQQMETNHHVNLYELSLKQVVLLVFLRHFGCTFCREALADISQRRQGIEDRGVQIVFVHMTDYETAERYFERYSLPNSMHISDPACSFYTAFGLTKGSFTQLFGLQSWIRGFKAGVVEGHGIGPMIGDGFQMPGVFVIKNGAVRDAFIHHLASDHPDYDLLVARCCSVD